MNSGDAGGFTRLNYDDCAYRLRNKQSTDPFKYRMSMDNFENEDKCVYDKNSFYHPFDNKIVNTESELKGIRRAASKCIENKYPNCDTCVSTFDPNVPIVLAQEVCPIVHNNIPRMIGPGYELNIDDVARRQSSGKCNQ